MISSILAIGRIAAKTLSADAEGRVLAVFSRSLYLQALGGELACIGEPSLGRGPLNAIVGELIDLDRLRPGAAWRRQDDEIAIDGIKGFAIRAVEPWRPPRITERMPPSVAFAILTAFASRHAPTDGLGPMVSPLLSGDALTPSPGALSRAAAGPLAALRDWISSDALGEPPAEIASLLGLGPGLTPSGDDALGGALIALRAYGRTDAANRLADRLNASAATATSTISRAHLACAIDGEGHESLHDALAALASADRDRIVAAAVRLAAVGHSSGWDALAGVAAVLAGLLPSADQRQR